VNNNETKEQTQKRNNLKEQNRSIYHLNQNNQFNTHKNGQKERFQHKNIPPPSETEVKLYHEHKNNKSHNNKDSSNGILGGLLSDSSGLLGGLLSDSDGSLDTEKILIAVLLFILAKEGKDIKLMMALGYILL
jgi:hypothetical protein